MKGSVQRYIYIGGVYRHTSDDEFRGVIRDYLPVPLHATRTINEVFSLFSMDADHFIHTNDLDSDENIKNFRNGILCLGPMKSYRIHPNNIQRYRYPLTIISWHQNRMTAFLNDLSIT